MNRSCKVTTSPSSPITSAQVARPISRLGWSPSMTNEEAYVAGHAAAPWAQISPKRRQELALGAMAAVLVVGGVGAAATIRRSLR